MEGGAANYIGSTPVFTFNNTQRALDRFYQQQQYQQAYNQKLYQQNAALLQKQFEGVRAADTPQITEAYNTWANLQKQLIANPNLATQNPNLYAQYKQATDQAESDIWRLTAQSKETAKTLNDINEDATKNWVNYKDDAHSMIANTHNMSSDEIAAKGYTDYNTYRHNGLNFDFTTPINNAIGKGKPMKIPNGQDGVNDIYKNYTIYNTPEDIYSSLGGNASRNFLKEAKLLQDRDMNTGHYQAVVDEYNNLKDETGLWGLKNHFVPVNPNDPITYLTALATLKAQPEQNSDTKEANRNREIAAQQQKAQELEQLRHRNKLSEQANSEQLKENFLKVKQAKTQEKKNSIISNMVNGWIDEAKNSDYSRANLGVANGRLTLNVPSSIKSLVAGEYKDKNGKKIDPDLLTVSKDGKYFIPVYFFDNGSTDGAPISINSFKQVAGDKFLSQKDFDTEFSQDEDDNSGVPDFLRK